MSETENNRKVSASGRLRRTFATILVAVLAVAWLVWGPLGPTLYLAGLFNSMSVWALLSAALLLLILFATTFAPALLVYTFVTWRRQSHRWETGLNVFLVVVISGLVGPWLVGLTGLTPSPDDMFVRGFAKYAQSRVDVEAIQSWLDSLNPKDYILGEYGTAEKRFVGSEQPPCIAMLHPTRATVRPDDSRHLTVKLLWGGGFIGHWGIVVGPKDMPIPPPGRSDFPEQRFRLAPGAYIWSTD